MMASGRAALAASGAISGSGLASAMMMGDGAIFSHCSGDSAPGPDSPRKMSTPSIASSRVRAGPAVA